MQANDRERRSPGLAQLGDTLERFLRTLLVIMAVVIFAGSVLMMLHMDGGSRSQGGRLYVAVAAIVALGAVDTQYARLVRRRAELFEWAGYRRYQIRSLLLLLLSAVALVAGALLLP